MKNSIVSYAKLSDSKILSDKPQRLSMSAMLLVKTLLIFPLNKKNIKLKFYNFFLSYLTVILLNLLRKNKLLVSLQRGYQLDKTNRIEIAFFNMLFHYNVISKHFGLYYLAPKYQKYTYNDWLCIENLVEGKHAGQKPSKNTKKLFNAFMTVEKLILLYRNHSVSNLEDSKLWFKAVAQKELDYEIRLCETLAQLRKLQLPQKIKSVFNDDYYTESGRSAFNNYTKSGFMDFVRAIDQNHKITKACDIGCGYGNYIDVLHELLPDAEIWGIELQEKVFKETVIRFSELEKIKLINSNIFEAQLPEKFNLVMLNYVLFYFSGTHKIKLFKKLHKHLDNDGSILICQYYSLLEPLKKNLCKAQNNDTINNQITQYYGNKILYANSLWNEASDAFVQSENWAEFLEILQETGFEIVAITNADKFYYSLFIEIKKQSKA